MRKNKTSVIPSERSERRGFQLAPVIPSKPKAQRRGSQLKNIICLALTFSLITTSASGGICQTASKTMLNLMVTRGVAPFNQAKYQKAVDFYTKELGSGRAIATKDLPTSREAKAALISMQMTDGGSALTRVLSASLTKSDIDTLLLHNRVIHIIDRLGYRRGVWFTKGFDFLTFNVIVNNKATLNDIGQIQFELTGLNKFGARLSAAAAYLILAFLAAVIGEDTGLNSLFFYERPEMRAAFPDYLKLFNQGSEKQELIVRLRDAYDAVDVLQADAVLSAAIRTKKTTDGVSNDEAFKGLTANAKQYVIDTLAALEVLKETKK